MRTLVSFVLAVFAAYAFSFAVDLLVGGFSGVYTETAFLPVVTWSLVSLAAIWFAFRITTIGGRLWIPYALFGLLAGVGGAVGPHRDNFVVMAALFAHALLVRRAGTMGHGKFKDRHASDSVAETDDLRLVRRADLLKVRRDILQMHDLASVQARQGGQDTVFKQEYVTAWERFRDDPTPETAIALLRVAPPLRSFFASNA
jgi:hypothetical protein